MKKINLLILFASVLFFSARPVKYDVGDTVANFKLKNYDGSMVSLSDYKDAKGAIVIFDCRLVSGPAFLKVLSAF